MFDFLKRFSKDEDGAVTVDWVVLCAGIVGLGVVATVSLYADTGSISNRTGAYMERQDVTSNLNIQDVMPGGTTSGTTGTE